VLWLWECYVCRSACNMAGTHSWQVPLIRGKQRVSFLPLIHRHGGVPAIHHSGIFSLIYVGIGFPACVAFFFYKFSQEMFACFRWTGHRKIGSSIPAGIIEGEAEGPARSLAASTQEPGLHRRPSMCAPPHTNKHTSSLPKTSRWGVDKMQHTVVSFITHMLPHSCYHWKPVTNC
jgi:hypothetical protein